MINVEYYFGEIYDDSGEDGDVKYNDDAHDEAVHYCIL